VKCAQKQENLRHGMLPYVLAYKSKNLGQFCPLKIGGGVDLYVGHTFFHKVDDVS